MKDKTLRTYLIWAFALAWPLQGLASWLALRGNMTGFTYVLAASMFAPLAALLPAKVPLKSLGWRLNLKGNVRRYLAAWLLPSVICALGAALYFLLFPAQFDGSGAAYGIAAASALSATSSSRSSVSCRSPASRADGG